MGAAGDDLWDRVTFILTERLRGEFVDWFRPPAGAARPGAERYDFVGSQLRAGVRVTFPHLELVLVAQDTRLGNLPDDAIVRAPPLGVLGPGALYFASPPETTQGEPFLKLGPLTWRQSGVTATIGRFEYSDGLETVPANPTLAAVKRSRIAERLVGPFGYSDVTRSFDGARVSLDRPGLNLTAMATRPTQGGFEVDANQELHDVDVAGIALTLTRLPNAPPADVRFFYLYYDDRRRNVTRVDNQSPPATDHDPIRIHSAGGHAITVVPVGPGLFDALLWGVVQAGEWGTLHHAAWAYAVEAGYQLQRYAWTPVLRVGYG